MKGFFAKFKEKLSQKAPGLRNVIDGLFHKNLDEEAIGEMEEALFAADFGVETTQEILDEIQIAYRADKVLRQQDVAQIGLTVLGRILDGAEGRLENPAEPPEVICLLGVNGAGKTTTSAKLAWHFKQQDRKTLLGACDTFRAAANEQIVNWSERLGVELVSSHHGADAASVAFDSYEAALGRGHAYLILDTAGRLHTKTNLLEELKKIQRVLQKKNSLAPHHRWLVLDGSLGTNSIEQAKDLLTKGVLQPEDYAFHEGLSSWKPISEVIATESAPAAALAPSVGPLRNLQLRCPIFFFPVQNGYRTRKLGYSFVGVTNRDFPVLSGRYFSVVINPPSTSMAEG